MDECFHTLSCTTQFSYNCSNPNQNIIILDRQWTHVYVGSIELCGVRTVFRQNFYPNFSGHAVLNAATDIFLNMNELEHYLTCFQQ